MAYASVVSLAQTADQLSSRIPGLLSDPTIESLAGSLEYFKGFLDDSSKRSYHQEKVTFLVRKFKHVLNEAEDIIELNICEIHERGSLSGIEKASEDLLASLLPVVQQIE